MVRHTEYCSDAKEDFTNPFRLATFAEKSKFIPPIATAPFPLNVKIPTILGKYNGMPDPSDHLLNFTTVGGVSGWTLAYWCHMFALTLTGATREWFEYYQMLKSRTGMICWPNFHNILVNKRNTCGTRLRFLM